MGKNFMTRLLPLVILFLILLIAVRYCQYSARRAELQVNDHKWDKLLLILEQIDRNYVDTIDYEAVIERTLPALMSNLDPHSLYLPPQELKSADESLEGNFSGIGIEFNVPDDTATVINVVTGGPSERAGLLSGDKIVKVDGENIAGIKMNQDSMVARLKGPQGSVVNIEVKRDNLKELLPFSITRDRIPVNSLDVALMLNDTVGYMKLSKFAKTSHAEFAEAAEKLRSEGLKTLIFDLRDNAGGYLDQALLLANEFLGKDELIVYMEGLHRKRSDFHADGKGRMQDVKLYVIINEGSASSSEIFAGAIQDNDRGTIAGRRSYGKGLVQQTIDLSYNGRLKLTAGKYYIPSGRCIQAINYRHARGGYTEHIPDSLTKVFRTAGGREVRDGGGIKPDIVVRPDSLPNIAYYLTVTGLDSTEVLLDYEVDYIAKHPEIAPAADFEISDADYEDFKQRVIESGFTYDPESERALKSLKRIVQFEGYYDDAKTEFENLEKKLKHNIARDLDMNRDVLKQIISSDIVAAYYFQKGAVENSLRHDKQVKAAFDLINNPEKYKSVLDGTYKPADDNGDNGDDGEYDDDEYGEE